MGGLAPPPPPQIPNKKKLAKYATVLISNIGQPFGACTNELSLSLSLFI